jgi:hypothetical protein
MRPVRIDRPGRIIFLAGVVLLVVSTSLGFYLARPHLGEFPELDWHTAKQEAYDALQVLALSQAQILANLHALMWMVFGLGVCLTLIGLRMLTRPNGDSSTPPLGSIREVFENPE